MSASTIPIKTKTPKPVAVKASSGTVPPHVAWLTNTGNKVLTSDKKAIELWEFKHTPDSTVLSAWAKHFRNQYCRDDEIDSLRSGTGLSRKDYLRTVVFPDPVVAPGPSIRAGDFAEVLVADYLEYLLKFWVPRPRYDNRVVRNTSTPGTDILGFRMSDKSGVPSPKDVLAIYEVKAQFTGTKLLARLQDAVDGSAKDVIRKSETLNAIKRRLIEKKLALEARKVERFQNQVDRPYREEFGAAACLSSNLVDHDQLRLTKCAHHPFRKHLKLVVMSGSLLMDLVSKLFDVAANES